MCVCVCVGGGVTPFVSRLLFSGECSSPHTPPHTHQAQLCTPEEGGWVGVITERSNTW